MEKMFPAADPPVVSKVPPERDQPCTRATWCILHEQHAGDCVDVPRKDIPRQAWGPSDPGWRGKPAK